MSEEALPHRAVKLTDQELQDLLGRKGMNKPCPCCGTRDWGMAELDAGFDTAILGYHPDYPDMRPVPVKVNAIVCNFCGFLRLHSPVQFERFLEWLKS